MSTEPMARSVTLAGTAVMLKCYAITTLEAIIVSLCMTTLSVNMTERLANAILVGEVHDPGFLLPPRTRYVAQDVACNGIESPVTGCSYSPPTDPECYVGNPSAAVVCREGVAVWVIAHPPPGYMHVSLTQRVLRET